MEFSDLKKGMTPDTQIQTDFAAEKAAESVVYPDEESKKATEKAMALLLHKDRTKSELEDRLYRAGYSETASGFALEYVTRYGYINDRRYAENYIDYHKTSKSRNEIRRKLKEKGIGDDVLSEVFREVYEREGSGEEYASGEGSNGGSADPEEAALQALFTKRLKGRKVSELTFEEKQKQMRYLAGKGYPIEKIRRAFLDV